MKKVVVIGLSGDSAFLTVDHFNYPGETVQAIDKFSEPGGKGYNQATFLGKLGVDVSFITVLGNDVQAQECVRVLKENKVKTYVIEKNMTTDYAVITTDKKGENNVVVYNKVSNTLTYSDILKYQNVIDEADILLLQLEYPYEVTKKIIEYAYEQGITVVLNPAPARYIDIDLLRKITYLIPNEYEVSRIIKSKSFSRYELMKELEQYGLETCICTMGRRPVECFNNGRLKRYRIMEDEPVDTTGAGDTFCAGFVFALTKNMNLDSAIRFAIHASHLSTLKHGVIQSFPTLREVLQSIHDEDEKEKNNVEPEEKGISVIDDYDDTIQAFDEEREMKAIMDFKAFYADKEEDFGPTVEQPEEAPKLVTPEDEELFAMHTFAKATLEAKGYNLNEKVEVEVAPVKEPKVPKEKKEIIPTPQTLLKYVRDSFNDVTVVVDKDKESFKAYRGKKMFINLKSYDQDYRIVFQRKPISITRLLTKYPTITKATSPVGEQWFKLVNKGNFEEEDLFNVIKFSYGYIIDEEEKAALKKQKAKEKAREKRKKEREKAKIALAKEQAALAKAQAKAALEKEA